MIQLTYTTWANYTVCDETADVIEELRRVFPGSKDHVRWYLLRNTKPSDAIHEMAGDVDVVIVVGSQELIDSASLRLKELAEKLGTPNLLTDCPEDIQTEWVEGKKKIGVTAGASSAWRASKPNLESYSWARCNRSWRDSRDREENMFFEVPRAAD